MSYTLAFAQRNINYSKEHVLQQNQSRKLAVLALILLIILFSVLYIVQVNNVATEGYNIQKYKNDILTLEVENKNIKLKLSEIQSPNFLEGKVSGLGMIKVGKVDYLSPVPQVAAK